MINFPLYGLRQYNSKFEENGLVILQTNKTRYVLDFVDKEGSYVDRRIKMLTMELPYKIYPLKERYETISQVVMSKRKKFIDKNGKIISWKPTTFYPVVCLPIKSKWVTSKGKYGIEVKGLKSKFIISDPNHKYAQVIQIGRINLLYDVCDEYRPMTRKKI